MKALMIGGQMHAMKEAIQFMSAPGSIKQILHHRNIVYMQDGSEIHMCVVKTELDIEYLRGLRFDLIVEHSTFPRSRHLLEMIRAMVLR